ncbi:hypothetical protein [Kineosporia sp. NBRC 101731]|uniref:hypothetical protein n=1 Tax=Kineosporia sp. NBRC 101731 TaxID=3032199 RepID=UPI00255280A7|nr:hypothetical protein [Kineosporia sp. NBRC 101731]
MGDLFATCHAIGRAEILLNGAAYLADGQRLALLREVLHDLRRDLGLPAIDLQPPATSATSATSITSALNPDADPTDGSTL